MWDGPLADTLGGINTAQMFQQIGSKLVINEVDYDQAGTDSAEFIELYNAGHNTLYLSDYTLQFVSGAGTVTYDNVALPNTNLATGDFFVICGSAAEVANCDLDAGVPTNFIQNGSPDALALLLNGNIVDALSYEGSVAGSVEGSGAGLIDDPGIALTGLSRATDGADSDANNIDFDRRCITPGTANSAVATGCLTPTQRVPVPATLALIGFGLLGLVRRRHARVQVCD